MFALKVINFNIFCDAGKSNVQFITVVSVPVPRTCRPFTGKSAGRRANSRAVRYGVSLDALYLSYNFLMLYLMSEKKFNFVF